MKKIMIEVVSVFVLGVTAIASPASLSTRAVIKGGEKVAAKLGLRTAGEGAVHGGAKLAAVTAERAVAKRTAGGVAEGVDVEAVESRGEAREPSPHLEIGRASCRERV